MDKKRIPEIMLPGFKVIARLNTEQVDAIAHLMKEIPLGDSGTTFFNSLTESALVKDDEVLIIARTLLSFGSLLFYNDKSNDELAENMSESFETDTGEKNVKEQLATNLKVLFRSSNNLIETFKAFELLSDIPNAFYKARILTDIRPLVDDKVEFLQNAVILHNLKIDYVENGEEKAIFIGMTSKNINELEKILQRAKMKEIKLKEEASNFHYIDLK